VLAGLRSLGPRMCLPPLWQELLCPLAASVGAVASQPTQPARDPGCSGLPVVLIPGLWSGDVVMSALRNFLMAAGDTVVGAGITCNVDCSEAAVARLIVRVQQVAKRHERPVALVGHSRGGLFARVLAQRCPGLVAGIVTLGTPHRDQLAVHPFLWAQLVALASLGSLGIPGVLRLSCAVGGCCADFRRDLAAPLPLTVRTVSIYSRRDGVVDWRACMDDRGRNAEVLASHCGMLGDRATWAHVASALAGFAAPTAELLPLRVPRPSAVSDELRRAS
jgi:triacylglycerol lipase